MGPPDVSPTVYEGISFSVGVLGSFRYLPRVFGQNHWKYPIAAIDAHTGLLVSTTGQFLQWLPVMFPVKEAWCFSWNGVFLKFLFCKGCGRWFWRLLRIVLQFLRIVACSLVDVGAVIFRIPMHGKKASFKVVASLKLTWHTVDGSEIRHQLTSWGWYTSPYYLQGLFSQRVFNWWFGSRWFGIFFDISK